MKRALSVKAITSDWCSWVADWWQAAKRRRRRSSACQLKEQLVCMRVCVCCTDKRNWQLTAGGRGVRAVCASVSVRVLFLTYLDISPMLMRDRRGTIVEFPADSALPRWHAVRCLSLTRMYADLDQIHANIHTNHKQTGTNVSFLAFTCHPNLEISALLQPYQAGSFQSPACSNLKYSTHTVNSCLTCGTLVLPDTSNLKQNTLDWATRPSADTRQSQTHCFLFQVCSISQAGLCLRACVHQALHHCLAAS